MPHASARRRFTFLLTLFATVAATLVLAPAAAAEGVSPTAEQRFLDATNAVRTGRGLSTLVSNRAMTDIARGWSQEMAAREDLSHNPSYRDQYPYEASRMGENVGYARYPTAPEDGMVDLIQGAFLDSPGHFGNIVGDYNQVGIGVVITGDTMWVTLDFIQGPLEPAPVGPVETSPGAEPTPIPQAIPAPAQVGEALGVSSALFADAGANRVVIARGDAFADALGGAPLAGDAGPVLLTPGPIPANPNPALDPDVAAEVDRVLAPGATAYLLGGTAAVSQAAEDQLRAAGHTVVRLAGASRVETAALVADEVARIHGDVDTVLLARADDWADAVAGGAWAADAGVPVLLTGPDELHPAADAFLAAHRDAVVRALGGPAALSDAVVNAAGGTRLAGRDRIETALVIAERLWGRTDARDGDRFVITPGYHPDGWAYALAYAPLSARTDAPQLLVGDTVPAAVNDYLGGLGYGDVVGASLTAATVVAPDVVSDLQALLTP